MSVFLGLILLPLNLILNSPNLEKGVQNTETPLELMRKTELKVTPYGNTKLVTYYKNNKPTLDSIYYYADNYPEEYMSRRLYSYNDKGWVKSIKGYNFLMEDYKLTEIEYNKQGEIISINYNNEIQIKIQYTNNTIILVHSTSKSDHVFSYLLDEEHNIISERLNGKVRNLATYKDGNPTFLNTMNVTDYKFSFLNNKKLPSFMRHEEFGKFPTNYILYVGGLEVDNIINTGNLFIDKITSQYSWANATFYYEFNEQNLPIYIKEGTDPYLYNETFFEYQ